MIFDKQKIKSFIKKENDYIVDLLTNFSVPDSYQDLNYNKYLVDIKSKDIKTFNDTRTATVDEIEDRLNTIKNKMKTKKRKVSEKSLKRRESKKLKKNKEFKKVLKSAQTTIEKDTKPNDSKKSIVKPILNAEGNIVFSKFDFAAHPGARIKRSKNQKVMKNPLQILNKIKETDKMIKELENQGDDEKVNAMKTDIAWKKVFDKVDGRKVKDDPKLLQKSIKRKKDNKNKSKKMWVERKNKVEKGIQSRQKKRTENIDKKLKERKNKKLKKLSKKGRIIPGF